MRSTALAAPPGYSGGVVVAVRAGDRVLAGRSELAALLGKAADAQREGAPRPELSERIVFFDGNRSAPVGLVLGAMREAAKVGIYKMAWLKEGAASGEMATKFRLRDPDPPAGLCLLKEEVRVLLKWDPKRGERIRWVNGRSVASLDALAAAVRELAANLRKMGRTELAVFLDVEQDLTWDDVSWREVAEVMDRCRAEGLDQFEFLPALRRAAQKDGVQQTRINEAKKEVDFDSWPRSQPLKPGLKFVPASVSSLGGYSIKKDKRLVVEIGRSKSLMRQLFLEKGAEQVRIELLVCPTETKDAHEALLRKIAGSAMPVELLRRGDRNGIQVGDLNFVREIDPALVSFIEFVRNNIMVHVRTEDSTLNVVALATEIDRQIVAEANFTTETIKTRIPTIKAFAPQSSTIAQLSSTPITLNVTDPQGRKLEFEFNGHLGQLKRDDSVTPPTLRFTSDDRPGQAKITVLVINENLLFDSAETAVTVSK